MMKTAMAAWTVAISCLGAQCALAQTESLPLVTNMDGAQARPQSQERPIRGGSLRVERLDSQLSEMEMARIDEITTGAAARAVVALRCEGSRFESVSKAVQKMMEGKVAMAASDQRLAMPYARDAAVMKYKGMLQANVGVPCADLDNLRGLAAAQGFSD